MLLELIFNHQLSSTFFGGKVKPVARRAAAFLSAWHTTLQRTRQQPEHKELIRWAVDVDPLVI
ncbi:MAG: hypothetical protein KAY02_06820 [Acidovorax sp.]|nr:hypothetical protein [Acidovorax sp.]